MDGGTAPVDTSVQRRLKQSARRNLLRKDLTFSPAVNVGYIDLEKLRPVPAWIGQDDERSLI